VKEQVNELVTKSRSEVAEWLSELEVQRREVASL
jgi:chromosome segregation ATPase